MCIPTFIKSKTFKLWISSYNNVNHVQILSWTQNVAFIIEIYSLRYSIIIETSRNLIFEFAKFKNFATFRNY